MAEYRSGVREALERMDGSHDTQVAIGALCAQESDNERSRSLLGRGPSDSHEYILAMPLGLPQLKTTEGENGRR